MRISADNIPKLPDGWENLPDEYEIHYSQDPNEFSYSNRNTGCMDSWDDLPCIVMLYYEITTERSWHRVNYMAWYKNDKLHRDDGKPAQIWFGSDGSVEYGFKCNGEPYNLDFTDMNVANIKGIV